MSVPKKPADTLKEAGRWSTEEHQRFMAAIATYGKDWKKVQQIVGTRSGSQVRSHAQKFFNKLLKQQNVKVSGEAKGKKKIEAAVDNQHQQSENSFAKFSHFDDGSNITPIEIVSLIKKESLNNTEKNIDIKHFKKKLQQQMAIIEEQENEEQLDQLKRQTSLKSMSNILEAYQQIKDPQKNTDLQNQSFLIGLTRQYKKYFSKGGKFQNLIDFGNQPELEVQRIQNSVRKQSFTLPEGVEGSEEEIDERRKRIIDKQQTVKMTEKQKQEFRQKIQNEQTKKLQEQKSAKENSKAQ